MQSEPYHSLTGMGIQRRDLSELKIDSRKTALIYATLEWLMYRVTSSHAMPRSQVFSRHRSGRSKSVNSAFSQYVSYLPFSFPSSNGCNEGNIQKVSQVKSQSIKADKCVQIQKSSITTVGTHGTVLPSIPYSSSSVACPDLSIGWYETTYCQATASKPRSLQG